MKKLTDEQLARKFHEVYERLAPSFGYETRKETRQFDPSTPNGKLMVAVCGELFNGLTAEAAEQREQGKAGWEGAEEWEQLAWHLCAEENGEDACTELVWEGGPNPEPWGDRWLKYKPEAKKMIELVRKYTTPPTPPAGVPKGWDEWERKTLDLAIEYAKAGVGMPQWEVLRDHVRSARAMLSAAPQPAAQDIPAIFKE